MVVCKGTGQAVCAGVGRPAKVDCPESDIVGDAIVPQLQRQRTQALRSSPAFMVDIADCRDVVASD